MLAGTAVLLIEQGFYFLVCDCSIAFRRTDCAYAIPCMGWHYCGSASLDDAVIQLFPRRSDGHLDGLFPRSNARPGYWDIFRD